MVNKNELVELDFHDITQYWDYIIESYINGQFGQAKELYSEMSVAQCLDFGDYIDANDVCFEIGLMPDEFIYFLES